MRTVSYETTLAGAEAAKKEISSMMESIERGDIVHNPVSEVGTMLNISENSMKENKEALSALLMEIQRIPENFNTLEKNIETRLSQMASTIVETIRNEQIQDRPIGRIVNGSWIVRARKCGTIQFYLIRTKAHVGGIYHGSITKTRWRVSNKTDSFFLGSRLFWIYVWREDWNRKQYDSGVHTGNALSSGQ